MNNSNARIITNWNCYELREGLFLGGFGVNGTTDVITMALSQADPGIELQMGINVNSD
jgi:hypothetical protein